MLSRLTLTLVVAVALPTVANAEVWQLASAPSDALAPLDPIAADAPLAFPARTAPRIIVGVLPGADLDAVAATLRPFTGSLRILRPVGELSLVASNGAAVADLAARDPRIAFAQPDGELSAQSDQFDSVDPATGILYDWQYDAVRAGQALAAVGGGSSTIVAIVDSGIDVGHPDLAGRILPGFDATDTDGSVTDNVGHGTFVAGLIAMVDGNGIGGKGIAGATRVLPVRASLDGGFRETATIAAITWAADHGAGVLNLSIGGTSDDPALDRAIDYATSKNVLVVAAAGNDGDTPSNPIEYPGAYVGGANGGWSIGLSVAATTPSNQPAAFSTHNVSVSIAAPGAGAAGCSFGDLSTIPSNVLTTEWDTPASGCNTVLYATPAHLPSDGRWAYGEGTSFSAPIVSAVAALVRQANPTLAPAQVADVLRRSATQSLGTGWNQYTGAGVVNAEAAVLLARTYDTTPPTIGLTAIPKAGGIQTDITGSDVVDTGKTPAGGVTIGLESSRDGVAYGSLVLPSAAEVHELVPTSTSTWLRATVCDANHNCAQTVAGPLSALSPALSKAHPSLNLRVLRRDRRSLKVRVSLGRGAIGKAVVQLESWTGKRWRAFDRVRIAFGKTATRTERVTRQGSYRLRAHLLAGPSFLPASSAPVTLRVG